MQSRVKFPHDVEQFGIAQLRESVVEEITPYAQVHNYAPVTQRPNKPEPLLPPASCPSTSTMPVIASMNSLSPMMQQHAQVTMMNGTPVILTPVLIQTVMPQMYNPQTQCMQPHPFQQGLQGFTPMSQSVPWVIDKTKSGSSSSDKATEAKESEKMETD